MLSRHIHLFMYVWECVGVRGGEGEKEERERAGRERERGGRGERERTTSCMWRPEDNVQALVPAFCRGEPGVSSPQAAVLLSNWPGSFR